MSSLFDDLCDKERGDVIEIVGRELIIESISRSAASMRYHCTNGDTHIEVELHAKDESVHIYTTR